MKKIYLLLVLLAAVSGAAQTPKELRLWNGDMPNNNGINTSETSADGGRVGNVSEPTIFLYEPDKTKNTGAAILICPGGGYSRLSMDNEGHKIAKWFAANGITAVVLKYRMPNGHHEVPITDAKQAMRLIRASAAEWGIDQGKIGVAGFSAGGHLASTLSTHFDAETRPDFSILFYPVITMDETFTHGGSRKGLLGENPNAELVDLYSNEKQISAKTPPTLLLHSDDDTAVPSRNSVEYYTALKNNKVAAALYIFPVGGHGWGFNENFRYHNEWKNLLIKWLEDNKFISK
ncbi:MAG: alpha/beta hydrolase [Rikenellaceae bacterium]|nr:alpha/beta hydrolase [Rikenellaceae bacterium]